MAGPRLPTDQPIPAYPCWFLHGWCCCIFTKLSRPLIKSTYFRQQRGVHQRPASGVTADMPQVAVPCTSCGVVSRHVSHRQCNIRESTECLQAPPSCRKHLQALFVTLQESIKTNTVNTCLKIGEFGFGRDPIQKKLYVVNFQLQMIYNLWSKRHY